MDDGQRAKVLQLIDDMEARMNELGALGTKHDCLPERAALFRAEMLAVIAETQVLLRQVENEPSNSARLH